jgi:hypothetical protein
MSGRAGRKACSLFALEGLTIKEFGQVSVPYSPASFSHILCFYITTDAAGGKPLFHASRSKPFIGHSVVVFDELEESLKVFNSGLGIGQTHRENADMLLVIVGKLTKGFDGQNLHVCPNTANIVEASRFINTLPNLAGPIGIGNQFDNDIRLTGFELKSVLNELSCFCVGVCCFH